MTPDIITMGLHGFFKFEAFKGVRLADGSVLERHGTRRLLADWQPNKMLDAGMNQMATLAEWMTAAQVGNGSTPPSASDASLESLVAGTSDIQNDVWGAQPSTPYYGYRQKVFRIAEGAAAGNLSEAGIGWGTSGATLISRHLIVDLLGDPTTITVESDEWLDVTYELRYYPPLSDVNGTATINGVIYDTITRAAEVTNSNAWAERIGEKFSEVSDFVSDWQAYDGTLGAITSTPSGSTASASGNAANVAYSNNSFELGMTIPIGSSGWNLAAGIRSVRIKTAMGHYQTQFNAQSDGSRIPKTSSYTMIMKWTTGWQEQVVA